MENDLSEMGFEGSGIVRAVGPGVSRFSVGDRVLYLGMGCFQTSQIMNEALCVRLDDSMTFKEGAALPLVYATAYYALVEKANLQHGQVSTTTGFHYIFISLLVLKLVCHSPYLSTPPAVDLVYQQYR